MFQINDIVQLIEDAGLGVPGKLPNDGIFAYHAPAEAKNCIIVVPSPEWNQIDPERPSYFAGRVQTIVRNSIHQDGMNICQSLIDFLTINDVETTSLIIKQLRPLHLPRVYRRSDSGMLEFSLNYDIRYVVKD